MDFSVDWGDRIDFDTMRRWRTRNLQEKMRLHQLDGIISFRAENIRYTTNFRPLWWPINFTSRNCAIIAQEGDPILYPSSGDWARSRATISWLPQDNIRPCGTMEDQGVAHTMVNKEFAPAIQKLGLSSGRIGVDAVNMHVLEELKAALPKVKFVPGDKCFHDAEAIKHAEEIKCMRISNKMAEIAHHRAVEALEPGVRECEVLAVAMHTFYSFGMEVPQCSLIVASGDNTAPIHRFASDRIIQRGDLVFMDLGGCFNGYFSDVTRTVCVGRPNDAQKRIYTAVYESLMKAREVMKPGATNMEVNRVVRAVKERHGFEGYLGVLGHAIGITSFSPPLIGEVAATGEAVFELQPGMIFSVEPTITIPGIPGGGGVRLEDCIMITENGNEVLSGNVPFCEKFMGEETCSCGCP
ncbi:MAG: aminopeptidase P family protein [Chloroflexi bacterium]|nr:aminopeptidase P family protein [Chloroflexota bacterium]